MIEFTVPGDAVPWARAGTNFKQRFTPAKQRNYMGALRMFCAAAMKGGAPVAGPIELQVMAIYAWPKSLSLKRRALPGAQWKTSRPDADNLSKIVKDALNTVAWQDDAQVVSLHCWKAYGEIPRLVVKIKPLGAPA